jgi:hypothetical protein
MVRRRTAADKWPSVPPLNTVRGAFRNGHNEIRLAVPVTTEVLRGSGQAIHPAVAAAFGVAPGARQVFASPHGEVTVFWKLSSTSGANVGSLRAQAVAVEATVRDTLVLAFRLDEASLEVTRPVPTMAGCVGPSPRAHGAQPGRRAGRQLAMPAQRGDCGLTRPWGP